MDKELIKEICIRYKIKNYTINKDESIDVNDNVNLSYMGLSELPLKFNKVGGYFDCGNNQLTTLEGSPKYVDSSFYCYNNKLTTLEGSPNEVGGSFDCSRNQLKTLKGSPESVRGSFEGSNNQITSLEGFPERIGHNIDLIDNKITSLKGSPMNIDGSLYLYNNPISIIDSSIEVKNIININGTNFDDKIKEISQDKLKILFEHGIDYDIFRKDGSINDSRLERMFKDFNI